MAAAEESDAWRALAVEDDPCGDAVAAAAVAAEGDVRESSCSC